MTNIPYETAIKATFPIPDHIKAAAHAIRSDLLYGPSWVVIPQGDVTKFTADCVSHFRSDVQCDKGEDDVIAQTYTSDVAQALRDFIGDLPAGLWVDVDCDSVSTTEPDLYEECDNGEDGVELLEVDLSNVWKVHHDEIVTVLFGRTIAHEFT